LAEAASSCETFSVPKHDPNTGAETGATEDPNLEETLEVIDNILLKMTEEESVVAAASTATEKGKNKLNIFWRKKILNFKIYLGKN
jgi:hypothetical protein